MYCDDLNNKLIELILEIDKQLNIFNHNYEKKENFHLQVEAFARYISSNLTDIRAEVSMPMELVKMRDESAIDYLKKMVAQSIGLELLKSGSIEFNCAINGDMVTIKGKTYTLWGGLAWRQI